MCTRSLIQTSNSKRIFLMKRYVHWKHC
uniref:Uncharacterized protein n=1 Tax=Anopheles quadriannulatus TaxID=34691 RepID=A0A182XTD3_ANOQN